MDKHEKSGSGTDEKVTYILAMLESSRGPLKTVNPAIAVGSAPDRQSCTVGFEYHSTPRLPHFLKNSSPEFPIIIENTTLLAVSCQIYTSCFFKYRNARESELFNFCKSNECISGTTPHAM